MPPKGKQRKATVPRPPRRQERVVPDQDSLGEPSFTATLESTKDLTKLLKSLAFAETCLVIINPGGIKISAQDAKSIKANAYFPSNHFVDFNFVPPSSQEDALAFSVHHATFMECLNIFGGVSTTPWQTLGHDDPVVNSPSVKLEYRGSGHPFVVTLEEGTAVTHCNLSTYEPQEDTDLEDQFKGEDNDQPLVLAKAVVLAEWLRETFGDIDQTAPSVIFSFQSGLNSQFAVTAQGTTGSAEVTVPGNSETLTTFQCSQDNSNSYSHSLIQHIVKALPFATKASIKTSLRGFLSVQLMIPMEAHFKQDDGTSAATALFNFVEFFLSPQIDD